MSSTSSATEQSVIRQGRAGRRALLAAALASAVVLVPGGVLLAHTPYRQWKVYRQRHLMIGASREDPATYPKVKEIQAFLEKHLPEASARVAPGPNPPASCGPSRDGPDPDCPALGRGCRGARARPAALHRPRGDSRPVAIWGSRADHTTILPSGACLDARPKLRRARRGARGVFACTGAHRDPAPRRRPDCPRRRTHARTFRRGARAMKSAR